MFHMSDDSYNIIVLFINVLDCLANCEECKNDVECLICYVGYRGVSYSDGIIISCVGKFKFLTFYWINCYLITNC